jgi:hypothetical protein
VNEAGQTLAELSTLRHARDCFTHDVFLGQSAKVNTVVRASSLSDPNGDVRPGATQDARKAHGAWQSQRGIPETPSLLNWET